MTPPAPSRRRFVLAAGGLALLGGCGHLIGPVPLQLYRLEPRPAAASDLPAVRWRLAVATPAAPEALDSERVALDRTATTLDYYADAAWTDRVPLLVQALLVRRFEDSGRILEVSRDTEGLRADYLLETDIRDFEARYAAPSGPPDIAVRITAHLVRLPSRDIVATLDAAHQATAARNDLDAVVSAFDEATADALDQIVAWTLRAPPPA